MIKAIVFDLDGTLLSVDQNFFFKRYLQDVSSAVPGVDPALMGESILGALRDTMRQNDPKRTVEQVYMTHLARRVGVSWADMKPYLEEYYREGFPRLGAGLSPVPEVRQILDTAKAKGYRVALATNPVFPGEATRERIRWAGLNPDEDFEFVTYFEHCHYTKPYQDYYTHEVLDRLDLYGEDCLMVGNDVKEDMIPAAALGMSTYLLTEHVIGDRDADCWDDEGGYLALLKTVESLPEI